MIYTWYFIKIGVGVEEEGNKLQFFLIFIQTEHTTRNIFSCIQSFMQIFYMLIDFFNYWHMPPQISSFLGKNQTTELSLLNWIATRATKRYSPWNRAAKATSVSSSLFLFFCWRPAGVQALSKGEIIQYARILMAKTKLQGE